MITGKGGGTGGGGGAGGHLPPPPISNTQKVPFFLSEWSALFLSEKCPFKVKHAPFFMRKRTFPLIFKSLNAIFLPLTGHILYREGSKWTKGHFYALMGHLAFHIRALIATAEPGNCPREPFPLPLKGHSQGRWNQGPGRGRLLPLPYLTVEQLKTPSI